MKENLFLIRTYILASLSEEIQYQIYFGFHATQSDFTSIVFLLHHSNIFSYEYFFLLKMLMRQKFNVNIQKNIFLILFFKRITKKVLKGMYLKNTQ